MRFVNDLQRKAVFASLGQRSMFADGNVVQLLSDKQKEEQRPSRFGPTKPPAKPPVPPARESIPDDQVVSEEEAKETVKQMQASEQYMAMMMQLRQQEAELAAQRMGIGAGMAGSPAAFQAGYGMMAPQIQPAAPAPLPPEAYQVGPGILEQQYQKYLPLTQLTPEVADVARGVGQAAKGGLILGALGYGAGYLGGMGGGTTAIVPTAPTLIPGTSIALPSVNLGKEPMRTAALLGVEIGRAHV